MLKNADGSGDEQTLFESDRLVSIDAWSPDGRYLVFTANGQRSLSDLWLLPLAGDKRPRPFLQSAFNKTQAQVSPDSRWIAYTSYESGGDEMSRVFQRRATRSRCPWAVCAAAMASRRQGAVLSLTRRTGDGHVSSRKHDAHLRSREAAFKTSITLHGSQSIGLVTYYDVSPDGQQFLCVIPSASDTSFVPITVVLNWQAALKT